MKKTGYAAPALSRKEFARSRVALVATRWNAGIVESLLDGARRCLARHGVPVRRVEEFRVPGAFELPLALEWAARSGRFDGLVALGAVIRGDTPHFDYVAGACTRGIQEVTLRHRLPVAFGVLTVNTAAQAQARAGRGPANKGYEAAASLLEMIQLGKRLGA